MQNCMRLKESKNKIKFRALCWTLHTFLMCALCYGTMWNATLHISMTFEDKNVLQLGISTALLRTWSGSIGFPRPTDFRRMEGKASRGSRKVPLGWVLDLTNSHTLSGHCTIIPTKVRRQHDNCQDEEASSYKFTAGRKWRLLLSFLLAGPLAFSSTCRRPSRPAAGELHQMVLLVVQC